MKKVISVLMCLLLCFSFPVTASAKTIPINAAQPYYEMAFIAESKLSISGTTATCKSTLRGSPDVTKIAPCKSSRNRVSYGFGMYDHKLCGSNYNILRLLRKYCQ